MFEERKKIKFTLFTTITYEDWPAGVAKYKKRIQELNLNEEVIFLGRVYNGPQNLDRGIRCMLACHNPKEAWQNAKHAEES